MKPYYEHSGITIYHGDCREILPGLKADVVLTDPPYNVGIDYGEHDDRMGPDEWVAWAQAWLPACIQKAETVLVTTGQVRLPDYARVAPWKWLLCWWKPAAMGRSPMGFCNWEPVALWGKGAQNANDFVRAPIIPDRAVDGHPCPKPEAWARGLLSIFGDGTILDPFMGSGTTLRAAKDLGRKAMGVEIEEKYCEIAAQRLAQEVLPFS